uniref:Transmembrane protein n=1 Tax=Trypanosoma congolense (strain IL3000) TaxID=1068625 RepID=G0UY34_TRYCI|nr:conserved hypothetical protein [Trypanosoma congolense IL3000]
MLRLYRLAPFATAIGASRDGHHSTFLVLPPVVTARRAQRSAPGRVRFAKEAHVVSTATPQQSPRAGANIFVNQTGMPVGEVEEGRRGFLGIGKRSGRTMPLNPLSALRPQNVESTEERSSAYFLKAIEKLKGKNKSRKEAFAMKLTIEQQQEIVNHYARTRWYGFLWHPFRNITERQFKWWRRITHFLLMIVSICGVVVALVLYYREVEAVLQLSPEDRRDYQHIVTGMRFSEIYRLSMEVLRKEDPLEALPAPARYRLVLDAARKKGWHKVDWELEGRTRYPRSPLEDMDLIHLSYWAVMYIGAVVTGGGELFSERFGNLMEVERKQKLRDVEASFVHQEVQPPPHSRTNG